MKNCDIKLMFIKWREVWLIHRDRGVHEKWNDRSYLSRYSGFAQKVLVGGGAGQPLWEEGRVAHTLVHGHSQPSNPPSPGHSRYPWPWVGLLWLPKKCYCPYGLQKNGADQCSSLKANWWEIPNKNYNLIGKLK